MAEPTYIHSSIGGRPDGFAIRGEPRSHKSSSISYRRAMAARIVCGLGSREGYDAVICRGAGEYLWKRSRRRYAGDGMGEKDGQR